MCGIAGRMEFQGAAIDAAARSLKDVLERTAIDVKKVMVYTITW